jgi:hypothetical protein
MATTDVGQKTHRSVLPQRIALESVSVDKLGVITKQDTDAAMSITASGVDHGRGERFGHTRHSDRNRHETTAWAEVSVPARSDPGTQSNQGTHPVARHPRVFVLDKHHKPLMPCHPARARELLHKGRARVHKLHPFTVRLIDRTVEESEVAGVQVKIDPGSRRTGIAVIRPGRDSAVYGVFGIEIAHRGQQIHRVAVRSFGSFNITTTAGTVQGIHHRHCRLLHRSDGWNYSHREEAALLPALKDGASARNAR